MNRALRFVPLVLLLAFVGFVAWRLATPPTAIIRSQLVGQAGPGVRAAAGASRPARPCLGRSRDAASRAWSMSSPAGACRASPRRRCWAS